MKAPFRRFKALGAAVLGAGLLAACTQPAPPSQGSQYGPRDNFTALWTLQQAQRMQLGAQNTIPAITEIPKGDQKTLPGYHVWDSWPARRLDTTVAQVNGWSVMVHLSVPETVLPGKRHDLAQLRWSYSSDGRNWKLGGLLFPSASGGAVPGVELGSRNWAGSAIITDDNKIYAYYTATGIKGENVNPDNLPLRLRRGDRPQVGAQSGCSYGTCTEGISYEQKLAVAYGPTVVTDANGVRLEGQWTHKILAQADGTFYQTQDQADVGPLNAFRDPWVFRDPKDGKVYMLFEGNVGGAKKSTQTCEPEELGDAGFRATLGATPAEAPWYNGNVGLAAAVNNDLTSFELLPPLLSANCVNQELERPLFVFKDGKYYLFVSSHIGKFAPWPGLREKAAEGLYGFVSDSLRGDYRPLNGSGLVLGNPKGQPFQSYSYDVLPVGDRFLVTHFIDVPSIGDINLVGGLPPAQQLAIFGGTLAPTLEIALEGDTTRFVQQHGRGQIRVDTSAASR